VQAGRKLLRIALIQSGSKITEDRTLKRRASVSVGQNATNTIVVPVSNLPPSFTLFEVVNDQYSLVFTKDMEGKVTVGSGEVPLAQAISGGSAKARGDKFVLPLTDASKGRVVLGEISLLFQFVAPPPEPPKAELPLEVRGGIFKQIDQFFFLVLAMELMVVFVKLVFGETVDDRLDRIREELSRHKAESYLEAMTSPLAGARMLLDSPT
jgi:hypothetical protein